MATQARPPTEHQPGFWSRRFRGNSPRETPELKPGNSPGGSVGGSPVEQPGGSPGRSPGTSPGGSVGCQVVGDSVFLVEHDGWIARSPLEYAQALIAHLQRPEYDLLHGQYISSKALEEQFYPEFLREAGWPPMPWRTIAIALGRLTKKRDKEFRCARNGEWQRRSVTQFLIPRPKYRQPGKPS